MFTCFHVYIKTQAYMAAVCSSANIDPISMPHLNCRASPHNISANSVLGQAEMTAFLHQPGVDGGLLSSIQGWGSWGRVVPMQFHMLSFLLTQNLLS